MVGNRKRKRGVTYKTPTHEGSRETFQVIVGRETRGKCLMITQCARINERFPSRVGLREEFGGVRRTRNDSLHTSDRTFAMVQSIIKARALCSEHIHVCPTIKGYIRSNCG